jgi:hypothetical protein
MIRYRTGYKYQLDETYSLQLPHAPVQAVDIGVAKLMADGRLTIERGYAWDGASGPTLDTRDSMRASLVHDVLYQMIRAEQLTSEPWRKWADELLYGICVQDGMSRIRAGVWYRMVRSFAGSAIRPSAEHPVQVAP